MDILKREIKLKNFILLLVFLLSYSCVDNKPDYKAKSVSLIGISEYSKIYNLWNDTLKVWALNKIFGSTDSSYSINYADSLLCFNKEKNRLVSCMLMKYVNKREPSVADGIQFFYGEKINNLWYFFKGDNIHVPREIVKGQDIHKPLSYLQLHEIALKEVYRGYLNSKGEINEEWFTGQFENVGWCSKCKTSEDFRNAKLEGVRTNWLSRDTTKPILQLP